MEGGNPGRAAGLARRGSTGGGALPPLLWAGAVPKAGALRPPACTAALLHPPEGTQHRVGSWEETQCDVITIIIIIIRDPKTLQRSH
ncbi:hypothetical protein EYF80_019462 [Liparis tanakae]|uniref:Uncharacterized protein n=1 Tax=Liparis tanakae TaxID=230148 RepID=A0A4Z2HX44_9TELE|nr:hypothetical protein EYF80_019462 [Liparis tanakae]